MADSIYQTLDPADASDRVAEKAKIVTDRLALIDKQNEEERKLFPSAPKAKPAAKAKAGG